MIGVRIEEEKLFQVLPLHLQLRVPRHCHTVHHDHLSGILGQPIKIREYASQYTPPRKRMRENVHFVVRLLFFVYGGFQLARRVVAGLKLATIFFSSYS